jgi:hypothetical protein
MPRKKILLTIPFASVGDVVVANNGKQYFVLRVDGAKAWLKHPNQDGTLGAGRPCFGTMVGNPTETFIPVSGDSEMSGAVTVDRLIKVDII